MKRKFVAVSDAENFYFTDRLIHFGVNAKVTTEQGMTKCILTGPYIIAGYSYQTLGFVGKDFKVPKKIDLFLIYLPNGYVEDLSKDYIKRLLSRNTYIA